MAAIFLAEIKKIVLINTSEVDDLVFYDDLYKM